MKKILITQRIIENDAYHEIRDCLDVKWAAFLGVADLLPIPLPSHYDLRIYFQELNIAGIIFSGGNDLSQYSGKGIDKTRDFLEERLIEYALQENIPVLGICRGMQLIGNFFGLTLEKVEGHAGKRHGIQVNEKSKYYVSLKDLQQVNSYHNYGFKETGDVFIPSVVSDDGIIEAMEHNRLKIFLQMWHPERENPFRENEIKFIREYFNDE